mmetsp:Transcript_75147/g.132826  ORF Transcript_75147/g.132826 Transcript_75147/m.132826 type:complete len:254 (+) Transcript_75147:457-1218(+)
MVFPRLAVSMCSSSMLSDCTLKSVLSTFFSRRSSTHDRSAFELTSGVIHVVLKYSCVLTSSVRTSLVSPDICFCRTSSSCCMAEVARTCVENSWRLVSWSGVRRELGGRPSSPFIRYPCLVTRGFRYRSVSSSGATSSSPLMPALSMPSDSCSWINLCSSSCACSFASSSRRCSHSSMCFWCQTSESASRSLLMFVLVSSRLAFMSFTSCSMSFATSSCDFSMAKLRLRVRLSMSSLRVVNCCSYPLSSNART